MWIIADELLLDINLNQIVTHSRFESDQTLATEDEEGSRK